MTLLDEIIDGSTSDAVSTPNVLRKVQVAATRLGADAIIEWARNELTGYRDSLELPQYRADMATRVIGTFAMPMQQFREHDLTPLGAPEQLQEWFTVGLSQPVTELQALATITGDGEPARPWPPHVVDAYEKSGALRLEWGTLYKARNVISRQALSGIVEIVRTKAMEFALDLQKDFPDAGSVDGPTLANEPALKRVVYNVVNNINGHGANVAMGDSARQRSIVKVGDVASLWDAARELGLSGEDADEFVTAVQADAGTGGPQTSRFIDRVRQGGIALASGTATNLVASGLLEAAQHFFGA